MSLLVEVSLKRREVSECNKRSRGEVHCGVEADSLILNMKEIQKKQKRNKSLNSRVGEDEKP